MDAHWEWGVASYDVVLLLRDDEPVLILTQPNHARFQR